MIAVIFYLPFSLDEASFKFRAIIIHKLLIRVILVLHLPHSVLNVLIPWL
jgi:hypothetical protein